MTPTDQQVGELDRRLTRVERTRRSGSGGGTVGPPGPEGLVWLGPWDPTLAYAEDDAVSYGGSSWIAPTPIPAGVIPGSVVVSKRTAYAYAFGVFTVPNCPILQNGVAYTAMPGGKPFDAWIVGSSGSSFDATPGSLVTIESLGGSYDLFKDAGPNSGSSDYDSHNLHPPGSFVVTMPASGRMTIEADAAMTSLKVSGSGMAPPAAQWDLLAASGDAGSGGDKNYVHTQGSPSATWTVVHGLGKYPAVEVVDTGNSVVIPTVHFDDVNTLTLSFGSPTSGKAFVN